MGPWEGSCPGLDAWSSVVMVVVDDLGIEPSWRLGS